MLGVRQRHITASISSTTSGVGVCKCVHRPAQARRLRTRRLSTTHIAFQNPTNQTQMCGFQLKPAGFFTRNPCLDLPSAPNAASVDNHTTAANGAANGNGNGAACCGGANGTA